MLLPLLLCLSPAQQNRTGAPSFAVSPRRVGCIVIAQPRSCPCPSCCHPRRGSAVVVIPTEAKGSAVCPSATNLLSSFRPKRSEVEESALFAHVPQNSPNASIRLGRAIHPIYNELKNVTPKTPAKYHVKPKNYPTPCPQRRYAWHIYPLSSGIIKVREKEKAFDAPHRGLFHLNQDFTRGHP
jgi:hypothetical protein